MTPLSTLAASAAPSPPSADRAKLAAAARQFEAIFVRQMLAAARKADFGDNLFGGQAMETFTTMQDEKFADIAAQTGTFGLARQLEAQLAKLLDKEG